MLVSPKKEVVKNSFLFYDRLTCPKLFIDKTHQTQIIPVNYIYGAFSFVNQLNHKTLKSVLEQNTKFHKVCSNHFTDNQQSVTPLNIWFANDLSTFISLDDLEDRLLAEENPPDLVVILNRGLLISLNKHTIEQIFALEQKEEGQSFDKAITANLVEITEKTLTTKYFKMGATASYKNLFYFYIILLDLLKNQPLPKVILSAEMVAIWDKIDS